MSDATMAQQLDQLISSMTQLLTETKEQRELITQQSAQIELLKQQIEQRDSSLTSLPLSQAYIELGHKSANALRQAIQKGIYHSGTEITRTDGDTGHYRVNVTAIKQRLAKEQSLKRVC